MEEGNNLQSPIKKIRLLRKIAANGLRIFNIREAKDIGLGLNIKPAYIAGILLSLKNENWIEALARGLYALSPLLLSDQPLHEYEIAQHLVSNSTISHFSAFRYHELTDQIPKEVYISTPTHNPIPRFTQGKVIIRGVEFRFIQVIQEHYFGIKKVWIGPSRINITDLERTLLDGLIKPKYCGGMLEVLYAFKLAKDRIDLEKLITYALKLDVSICKRLGWVLEKIGIDISLLTRLQETKIKGFIKLDPSGAKNGNYHKNWQIQENI